MRKTSSKCFVVFIFSTLLFAFFTSQASAQSCSKRVVILDFSGPGSNSVRTGIIKTLDAQGCTLVPSKKVPRRLNRSSDYTKAASRIGIDAFIEGSVKKSGRNYTAEVSVRNGSDGEVLKSTSWRARSAKALARSAQRSAWRRLSSALEQSGEDAAAEEQSSDSPSSGKRIAVLPFDGPKGVQARSAVEQALKDDGHEVLESAQTDAVMESLGGQPDDEEAFVALAKELNADAIVVGNVSKQGKGYEVVATAHNGMDGEELEESSASAKRSRNLDSASKKVAKELSPKLNDAQRPGQALSDDSEQDDDNEEDSSDDEELAYVALDAFVGSRFFSRSLSYKDDINAALRGYEVFPAFAIAAGATWFPGAHFTNGVGAHIGIQAYFESSLGLNSTVDGSTAEFPTSATAYSVGLVGRIPVSKLEILPALSYGSRSFKIDAANATTPKPDIANVAYSHARLGASARYALGSRFALMGGLGYQLLLSAGEIEDTYFPNLSGGGLDLSLGAGYRIVAGLEARLELNMQRYFMTMNPEVGDSPVAGGALDQWFGATLSLAYRLGGPDPDGN
ncbi:MAG: hypothetical protein IPJ88_17385 [Myxococcales bacterium]|nr:MAG: hypothetical protein IPJ88_17385 [Myxococcales bacterium]